jgi:hypothetical protein
MTDYHTEAEHGRSVDNDRMPWDEDPSPEPVQPAGDASSVSAGDSTSGDVVAGEIVDSPVGLVDVELPPVAPVDRTPVARGFSIEPETILDRLSDPEVRFVVASTAETEIKAAVHKRAAERRAARVERLDGEEPESESDVRREAVGLANDADVLLALAGAFTAGAKEAQACTGDLLDELPGRGGKPRQSLKVGDGDGFTLNVTRTQAKEVSTDDAEVVEVLVAWLLSVAEADTRADRTNGPLALGRMPVLTYAEGVRAGIEGILALRASGSFKVTALDALVTTLENLDDDTLARRLRKAYGRRDKGEPTIKVERKPVPAAKADA